MRKTEYQSFPDGTEVRFTEEARKAMVKTSVVLHPLSTPALGAEAIYTIENTDDNLHDVILRETGERYGTAWLERAHPTQAEDQSTRRYLVLDEVYTVPDTARRNLNRHLDELLKLGRSTPEQMAPTPARKPIIQTSEQLRDAFGDIDPGLLDGTIRLRTQSPEERGNWMQTFTGRQFYPMDPRADEVDIRDIAHALSMQCRYNGHVHRYMSVAEHCVLVSQAVPAEDALWGLLHDATEAYVGDMVRPLKLHMPDYCAVEDRVMAVIAEKFGIAPDMPASVHEADSRILLDERAALLGPPPADWKIPGQPLGIQIHAWPAERAEREYLDRFEELTHH